MYVRRLMCSKHFPPGWLNAADCLFIPLHVHPSVRPPVHSPIYALHSYPSAIRLIASFVILYPCYAAANSQLPTAQAQKKQACYGEFFLFPQPFSCVQHFHSPFLCVFLFSVIRVLCRVRAIFVSIFQILVCIPTRCTRHFPPPQAHRGTCVAQKSIYTKSLNSSWLSVGEGETLNTTGRSGSGGRCVIRICPANFDAFSANAMLKFMLFPMRQTKCVG